MSGLVEQLASQIGWHIAENNVVVEGTSDVSYLKHASILHAQNFGRPLIDATFAVVAAGKQDDGGVDGINRRLNTFRQVADADRNSVGALTHRFIGLFDNDRAGRTALSVACRFDRRLQAYVDMFLVHPIMPILVSDISYLGRQIRDANRAHQGLDWEIEDLCSERILEDFESKNSGAITSRVSVGGKTHREFLRRAKPDLRRHFLQHSDVSDVGEMLALLKALRSYVGLDHNFVKL